MLWIGVFLMVKFHQVANSQRVVRHTFVTLKGLDAFGSLNFKPHELGLAAISMIPSTKIVKGCILYILV
jgi:hypothetical protein